MATAWSLRFLLLFLPSKARSGVFQDRPLLLSSPTESQANLAQVLCSRTLHALSLGPVWSQGARCRLPGSQKKMPWKMSNAKEASLSVPLCRNPLIKFACCLKCLPFSSYPTGTVLPAGVYGLLSTKNEFSSLQKWFFSLSFFSLNYSNKRTSRPTLSCCCNSYFIPNTGCRCPNC